MIQNTTIDQRKLVGFGLYFERLEEPTLPVTFDTENFTYFLIDWDYFDSENRTPQQFINKGIVANADSGFKNTSTWVHYDNDQRTKIQFFADIDVNGMVGDFVIYRFYSILEEADGTRVIEPIKNINGQVGMKKTLSYTAEGITYELNINASFVNALVSVESIEFNEDNTILKRVDLSNISHYTVEGAYIMVIQKRIDSEGSMTQDRTLIDAFYYSSYDVVVFEEISIANPMGDKAIASQRVIELDHVSRNP